MAVDSQTGKKYSHPVARSWLKSGEEFDLVHGPGRDGKTVSLYAKFDNRVVPFGGHRVIEEIEIAAHNYIPGTSESGDVRPGGRGKIFFNRFQVYTFAFNDVRSALRMAEGYIEQLRSFPVLHALDSREHVERELIGRKVWYRAEPAVVESLMAELGVVQLHADNGDKKFTPLPWHDQDSGEYRLREDLLSPFIHWFRGCD